MLCGRDTRGQGEPGRGRTLEGEALESGWGEGQKQQTEGAEPSHVHPSKLRSGQEMTAAA